VSTDLPGLTRNFQQVGVFGSELLPATSRIDSVAVAAVAFRTDPEAVRELLPHHFEPAQKAVVRVSHLSYDGIDYLAGRGYNVVSVSVPVVYAHDASIAGTYNVVVWEGLSHAVTLGRELQGYAKIYGEIPDAVETEAGRTFHCSEYGSILLDGEVHDLTPFTPEQLARLQSASSAGQSLGWKYIPGLKLTSEPDCDYATRIANPLYYEQAWSGTGTVSFGHPTWEQAPVSSRVLGRLRELPVLSYQPAFVGKGSASAPRGTVERLAPAAGSA
jgi:acetoacetate decarboxylase